MIKTFAQACKKLGLNPKRCLPGVSHMPKKHGAPTLAAARLMIITEALNDGWEPNWDENEDKYWAWWWMNKPGFRLGDIDSYWTITYAGVGSRLCFRTRALAEHAAKYFKKDYEVLMVIPPKKVVPKKALSKK